MHQGVFLLNGIILDEELLENMIIGLGEMIILKKDL
jgi:hypothetical protein